MATVTTADLGYGQETDLTGIYSGILGAVQREQNKVDAQEQELQRRVDAENKQLSSMIASINPEGIKTADTGVLSQRMDEVKDIAYKMYTAESDAERLKYRAEVQAKLTGVRSFIGQSKQVNKELLALSRKRMDNPYVYGENFNQWYDKTLNTPTPQLSSEELQPPVRRVDSVKVFDRLTGIAKDLLKTADIPAQRVQERGMIGSRGATYTSEVKQLPPELYADRLLQEYQINPEFKAYLAEAYPDLAPAEAITQIVGEVGELGALTETRDTGRVLDTASGSGRSTSSAQPAVSDAQYDTYQNFANNQFFSPVYLPLKSDNITLSNVRAVNLQTGQPIPSPVSGKIDATGLVRVPILNEARAAFPKGSIATPDFARDNPNLVTYEDYFIGNLEGDRNLGGSDTPILVPKDRFPTTTKQIKTDIQTFNQAAQNATSERVLTAQELIEKYSR